MVHKLVTILTEFILYQETMVHKLVTILTEFIFVFVDHLMHIEVFVSRLCGIKAIKTKYLHDSEICPFKRRNITRIREKKVTWNNY